MQRKFELPSIFDSFLNVIQSPLSNIVENKKEFVVEMSTPGFKKNLFEIDIKDKNLTISYKEKEESTKKYNYREFKSYSFSKSFLLPSDIDADKINASYEDGILSVKIPKVEKEEKSNRKIEVI